MRTAKLALPFAALAFVLTQPALAFDGTKSTDHRTPMEAFRYGAAALKTGETEKAVVSLEYAAENGHPLAQWKLGRMYAEGEGVPRNDLRAFEYFRRIADSHADDNPGTAQARFVANAFVALGHYYLEGIPKTSVKRDPARAREMFAYAASYFGDPDAQYNLGRMYLEGVGGSQEPKQAARWLWLSAHKGQTQAQALLGTILFTGEAVPRQAARGLMWLTLAKDAATADQAWVTKQYESAFKQATDDERALALVYLQRWMSTRRE
jgi:TPR repeat protein